MTQPKPLMAKRIKNRRGRNEEKIEREHGRLDHWSKRRTLLIRRKANNCGIVAIFAEVIVSLEPRTRGDRWTSERSFYSPAQFSSLITTSTILVSFQPTGQWEPLRIPILFLLLLLSVDVRILQPVLCGSCLQLYSVP